MRILRTSSISVRLLVPPNRVLRSAEEVSGSERGRWGGAKGHLWEQLALPRLSREAGATLLLHLANTGLLRPHPQVVAIHDLAPFLLPESFRGVYAWWSRRLTRRISRNSKRIITVSERSRRHISEVLRVPPERISVIANGVGAPFNREPSSGAVRSDVCVFVGGHDPRKNLAFLLSMWEAVYSELGLRLAVVYRTGSGAHRGTVPVERSWLVSHTNLSDDELVNLYATSLCVVSPSIYEGFGLPLLEAMAVGTPFLSSDTGAARELAVSPEQVVPLKADVWRERLRWLSRTDISLLERKSIERAKLYSWEASAEQLVTLLLEEAGG
jgi:glycosyltransferase involved in cell wall biosynthesis